MSVTQVATPVVSLPARKNVDPALAMAGIERDSVKPPQLNAPPGLLDLHRLESIAVVRKMGKQRLVVGVHACCVRHLMTTGHRAVAVGRRLRTTAGSSSSRAAS